MFRFGQWEEAYDPKLWESSVYGQQISPSTSQGGLLPVLKNIVETIITAGGPVAEEYLKLQQAKEATARITTPVVQPIPIISTITGAAASPWTIPLLAGGGFLALMMLRKKKKTRR